MAYVYRHIRLDKNVPFYIGIGSDDDGLYLRSKTERGRNDHWKNIVCRTRYEVEIIIDNVSWETARKKEIEFIALYKRAIDGGTLSNLTLGGEGQLGMCGKLNGMYGRRVSEETRAKQSLKKKGKPAHNKGKPMPLHQLEKLVATNTGRASWNKGRKPSKESIEKRNATMKMVGYKTGVNHPMFGKTHSDALKERWMATRKGVAPWNKGKKVSVSEKMRMSYDSRAMAVVQYSIDGVVVNDYVSINDAALKTGIGKGNISTCCKGNRKSAGGFLWGYKKAPIVGAW